MPPLEHRESLGERRLKARRSPSYDRCSCRKAAGVWFCSRCGGWTRPGRGGGATRSDRPGEPHWRRAGKRTGQGGVIGAWGVKVEPKAKPCTHCGATKEPSDFPDNGKCREELVVPGLPQPSVPRVAPPAAASSPAGSMTGGVGRQTGLEELSLPPATPSPRSFSRGVPQLPALPLRLGTFADSFSMLRDRIARRGWVTPA
jgi:hypothetical protein